MITIETQPSDFGRVYDTNRLMYKFSSTNYTEANFRFYISVGFGDITQNPVTWTSIGIVRKRPLTDGTCFFNPAELWSSYLEQNLELNTTGLVECLNSNSQFTLAVAEEYGSTPVVVGPSVVEGDTFMLYNGLQEYIPYDIEIYGGGNEQWVMTGDTVGGKYLTDAIDYKVDVYDYGSLHFIAKSADRPTHMRVKVYYTNVGVAIGNGGGLELASYMDNSSDIEKSRNSSISSPNITTSKDGGRGQLVPPSFKQRVSSYYDGIALSYSTTNNQMYQIPTGPKELDALGVFDHADVNDGWLSYQIDLTDGLFPTSIVYNSDPMYYYRKSKCSKYEPVQIFWLNPHGGYDTYTFYKKNYISYDVDRTTWQHRFSDTYTLGERGTTVYKTKAVETITLNTDWLSESESQTLSQMVMSPDVNLVYDYLGEIYKIPYVISTSKLQYKERKNEKMVSYEIEITPAWNRVSQTS